MTVGHVREATAADRADWRSMRLALYGEDPDADREIDSLLADPRQSAFVLVRDDGHLAGLVEVALREWAEGCSTSPVGYIEGIWIDPPLRRTGLGRLLFEAAEDWARRQGCTEMGSDALLDNTLSHAVHRAVGYSEVERVVCFRKDL